MNTFTSLLLGVAIVIPVVLGMGVGEMETPTMRDVSTSVEVGVKELSPAGELGGYAIPASGDSDPYTCTISISPSEITVGDAAPTMIIDDYPNDPSFVLYGPDGELIWHQQKLEENIYDTNSVFTPAVLNTPGTYVYRGEVYYGRKAYGHGHCEGSFTVTDAVAGAVKVTSCTVNPNPAEVNQTATWTANVTGGRAPYRYDWDFGGGDVRQVSSNNTTNGQTKQYATAGKKNTTVRVLDADGKSSGFYPCEVLTVEEANLSAPTNVSLDIRKLGTGNWTNSVNITASEQVELRWNADNATRCVGDTYFSTGSGSPTSGIQTNVSEPGSGSRTYKVTCFNGSGSGAPSVSDTAVVNVSGGVTGPPEITVNPSVVNAGDSTTITWDLNGHTGCSVTSNNDGDTVGANPKSSNGSGTSDPIYGESTYTVTCTDDGSTDSATVRIRPDFEEI